MHGITNNNICRLKQPSLTRLVTGTRKIDRITSALTKLNSSRLCELCAHNYLPPDITENSVSRKSSSSNSKLISSGSTISTMVNLGHTIDTWCDISTVCLLTYMFDGEKRYLPFGSAFTRPLI